MKTPKDVTQAVNRAQAQLTSFGVDVKYTQVMSAVAAYFGYSNREEFLQAAKSGTLVTLPATTEASVKEVPSAALVDLMAHALERLANKESVDRVLANTGIQAKVAEEQRRLQGLAPAPVLHNVSFIDRLMKMSPQELRHADFQMVMHALRRAFDELIKAHGGMPGWIRPFLDISTDLEQETRREALERDYPYQVVVFSSVEDFDRHWATKLITVRDLTEGISEMRHYLGATPQAFGCALQSLDGRHTYTGLVRSVTGGLCEKPDGLTRELGHDMRAWDLLARKVNPLFRNREKVDGYMLRLIFEALESRLRRGQGEEHSNCSTGHLGIETNNTSTCRQLYQGIVLAHVALMETYVDDNSVEDPYAG